jgi:hypothetical protein
LSQSGLFGLFGFERILILWIRSEFQRGNWKLMPRIGSEPSHEPFILRMGCIYCIDGSYSRYAGLELSLRLEERFGLSLTSLWKISVNVFPVQKSYEEHFFIRDRLHA